jgi:hypothetical protein
MYNYWNFDEDDQLFLKSLVQMIRYLRQKEGRTKEFYEMCLREAEERGTLVSERDRRVIAEAVKIAYKDEAMA